MHHNYWIQPGKGNPSYKTMNQDVKLDMQNRMNWLFRVIVFGLFLISAINICLDVVNLNREPADAVSNVGMSVLYAVSAEQSTMTPKIVGGHTLCDVTIDTHSQSQIYRFVDRPYREQSDVISAYEFAMLWEDGAVFDNNPPNTAVKTGSLINFNTVEITHAKFEDAFLHLVFKKPTDVWGGLHADDFCANPSGIEGKITLFVNNRPIVVERGGGRGPGARF
jgi:hypothetical protein